MWESAIAEICGIDCGWNYEILFSQRNCWWL